MTKLTEGTRNTRGILSEANFHRSRDKATMKSGSGVVEPMTVCGIVSTGTAVSAIKSGGNTGNGVLTVDASLPVRNGAKNGVYKVRLITAAANGGTFRVEDPDGNVLGDVAVGATFDDDIKFAVADGATDFVVGDGFDITVVPGALIIAPSRDAEAAGFEGAEVGTCVNLYRVDATSEAVGVAIISRDAELNGHELAFHASVNTDAEKATKVAQLARQGVIVRY